MTAWYEIFDERGRPVLATEREEVAERVLDMRPAYCVYAHACRRGEGGSAAGGACPHCGEPEAED